MKKNTLKPLNHNRGFTLIELMLSLVLGLLLVTGIIQIYVANKATYNVQEGLSRLQENGRFAVELITRDMRMAGYTGCISRSDVLSMTNVLNNNTDFHYNFAVPIQGFESTGATTWSPAVASTIQTGTVVPTGGTDILSIRTAERTSATVTAPMANSSADISITVAEQDFNQDDIFVIADCEASAVAMVTNSPAGSGATTLQHTAPTSASGTVPVARQNTSADLGRVFGTDAEILRAEVITYFIAPGASGEPALWRLFNNRVRGGNNPMELVEGIEDIQIRYGEDTDADGAANIYRTANNVPLANWNNIVSIRISLLLRTLENNLATEPLSYTFNGTTQTATDRRIRRVFTGTIGVRNRLL